MLPVPADSPADVKAQDGEVSVEGPNGIKYVFTPAAAIETSDRLLLGGIEANGQRMLKEDRQREADERNRNR
ncbi:MAG TPA: hypothetical protein VGC35_14185 [Allosphingosinicella sp.]|jgi:hypothetical protein